MAADLRPCPVQRHPPKITPHDLHRHTAHATTQTNPCCAWAWTLSQPSRFPAHHEGRPSKIYDFCAAIVDATADLVCLFKPQIAYFAAYGPKTSSNA